MNAVKMLMAYGCFLRKVCNVLSVEEERWGKRDVLDPGVFKEHTYLKEICRKQLL